MNNAYNYNSMLGLCHPVLDPAGEVACL